MYGRKNTNSTWECGDIFCSDDELISIQIPGTNERLRSVVEGIKTWNPSFDVTPSELISGIVTETGVSISEDGTRDLTKFLAVRNEPNGSIKVVPFTSETVMDYIWSEVSKIDKKSNVDRVVSF